LADNQILVYDSATSKWINEANSASAPVTSVNTQTGAVVLDTDDISEGSTNLYYADSLVDAHLVGGTGVTYSAGNISIGQPVATTDDVEFNEVTAAEFIGNLRGANLMKSQAGEALTKGDVVYISGISGNTPVVSKADANDSTKMPAVGLANATVLTSANVDVLTFGQITNIDTTQNIGGTWAEGDSLYVNTTAGQLTKTQPTGETSLVQKIAKIEKVHASTGLLLIQGAGRSNATPNLNDGNIFIGNSSNYATTSSLDTEVSALGYITASSTDTLTNKSGNISQWTNDAGYLTSETDSQTLSFSSPNLTISNGNSVDISAITSGYLQNVVEDTTPELGGDLDTKDFVIKNTGTGDIGTVDIEDGVRIINANLRFSNAAKTFNTTLSATTPTANTNAVIPNHTGYFALFGTEPTGAITDGTTGQVLTTNGSGGLSFTTVSSGGLSNVVEDTTPQLGGDLDVNGNSIVSTSNGNITLTPNGTGDVVLGNFTLDADQTVGAGQDNYVLTYDNGTGKISLEAAPGAGGGISNVVEDTTPQLGGTLDTNDQTITNAGVNNHIDVTKRIELTENVANNLLQLENQNNSGLGLSIKAGNADQSTYGSLAILSVADKDSNLRFIVKASGEVNVYDNLGVDSLYIDNADATTAQISTLTSGHDLNITTNAGTLSLNSLNWPASDGSANQLLKTDGAGQLSFVNASDVALTNVVEDTTPDLGGELDQKGNMIKDTTRAYQILGDQSSPSNSDYDSFSNTNRVYGVVNVAEVVGPSNRVHSHPTLTKVTATANSSNPSNGNAGRLRGDYSEFIYELDGFDNTTTGFGRGLNGQFVSAFAKNNNASNTASTLTEQRGLTLTTQYVASSTGGLTVSDSRCINMEPNINSNAGGAVTVTNQYGLYYSSVNNDASNSSYTNEYSLYGNTAKASAYNAGGFQMPVVTVSNLSTLPQREGNTAYVTDNTAGTGSVAKCLVFYDGSNWKLSHEPGTTAA
jgi:hypothetical protein